jgi:hypothetical protein
MSRIKIQLPELHAAQKRIKAEAKRNNVIVCGRRFGKNFMLQDIGANGAMAGKFIGWGAPVYRQVLDDYRALENLLAPVMKRASISEMRQELITGGVIEFHSLEKPDNVRGKKYHDFIVNEAGFVANLMDIRNFVITPTLIDYQGVSWYAGTPKGLNGFATLYQQQGDEWARWQMSSYSNPHIPPAELDSLKNLMPERAFQQEIMAQFLEDGGGVFRRVREASTLQPQEPVKDRQYIIGVDWGRSNDSTVLSVLDAQSRQQVFMDRMTDTDYASQRIRLVALSNRYNNAHIIAEANSMGQPNIEALQNAGVYVTPFTTTNSTKANIIQGLELAFERGEIALLNDEIQINELMAYQSEKLPSGLVRYGSPDGLHDDTVMALAIAWSGVGQPSPNKLIDFA